MSMCAYLAHKPDDWVVIYPIVHKNNIAINTGIIGGNDVEFLKNYTSVALEIITSNKNKSGFITIENIDRLVGGKIINGCNVVTEQYLYSRMCIDKNKWNDLELLLDESEVFAQPNPRAVLNRACRVLGYTHLIALSSKTNPETMWRLRHRIKAQYSGFHMKIKEMATHAKA